MSIEFSVILTLAMAAFPVYFMFRVLRARTRQAVQYPFFITMLSLTIWYIGSVFVYLYHENEVYSKNLIHLCLTGIITLAPSFLITAIAHFKGNIKPYLICLYILPLVSIVVIWTNTGHLMFIKTYSFISSQMEAGSYYYVHAGYSYLCVAAAFTMYTASTFKKSGVLSKQSLLILGGSLLPFIVSILVSFKFIDTIINKTLFAAGITMVFFWVAIFKYDFLNIVPIAMEKIVNNFSDAIVVINGDSKIIEYNKSFADGFIYNFTRRNNKIPKFQEVLMENGFDKTNISYFEECIEKSNSQRVITKFEQYVKPMNKYYFIEMTPVENEYNYLGTVIQFKDISEYKILLSEIKEQNDQLVVLNGQLALYAETERELTLQRERNRIQTEIHNLMSYNLNVMLRLMELSRYTFHDDPCKSFASIVDAETTVNEAIHNGRKIARNIVYDPEVSNVSPLQFIEDMITVFTKRTGISVEYLFEGDFYPIKKTVLNVIYNLCQEAMSNSMKHGNAKTMAILLKKQGENISLNILDDGKGCELISKSGMGLKGMEDMVKELQGNITFISDGYDGFKISVSIPV